jgi:CBS domain-containing protein
MGHHDVGSGFQTALDRLAEIGWAMKTLGAVRHEGTRSKLAKMLVSADATLAAALRVFEGNHLGTVFVVDADNVVVGVATDGDIRRGLIAGQTLGARITEVMTRNFEFVFDDASPADIRARLSSRCRVLPILDAARRMVDFAAASDALSEAVPSAV